MLRSVLAKTVHDLWRPLLAWTAFSALWPMMYVALYPSIGAVKEMQELLDRMPRELLALFASEGLDLATPEGFLNMELFSFVLPLIVMAWTVTLGAGATAGEEERGTLDLLLANPVPRWRIVTDKAVAAAAGLVVLCGGVWGGVALGAALVGVDLDHGRIAAGIVAAWFLGAAFGGIAFALGSVTGRRGMAMGGTLALAVAAFFLNALGSLAEGLEPWRPLSPFFHYIGGDPLNRGSDPAGLAVLAAIALAGVAVAVAAFERRDLAA